MLDADSVASRLYEDCVASSTSLLLSASKATSASALYYIKALLSAGLTASSSSSVIDARRRTCGGVTARVGRRCSAGPRPAPGLELSVSTNVRLVGVVRTVDSPGPGAGPVTAAVAGADIGAQSSKRVSIMTVVAVVVAAATTVCPSADAEYPAAVAVVAGMGIGAEIWSGVRAGGGG